jgi:hypothetical protein
MAKCQNNSGNCKLIMAIMWRIMANGPKIMATERWYGKTHVSDEGQAHLVTRYLGNLILGYLVYRQVILGSTKCSRVRRTRPT